MFQPHTSTVQVQSGLAPVTAALMKTGLVAGVANEIDVKPVGLAGT